MQFLFLYVSQVRNKKTTNVGRTMPTYIAWSDTLLCERQNYDEKHDCSGEGKIEGSCSGTEVRQWIGFIFYVYTAVMIYITNVGLKYLYIPLLDYCQIYISLKLCRMSCQSVI